MFSCKSISAVKIFVGGFLVLLQPSVSLCGSEEVKHMSKEERTLLQEEARDMFYHAYNAYMENAYPADELMPLSCQGRYRGVTPNRGDIDDPLGNFSLTLIDTLDSLVVLNDMEEFEQSVKLVIKDVNFDNDVVVSVFETNIRVVGGLLSAHILADLLQQRDGIMPWYKGELLSMAKDIGYRLLPAFNTTTGIPYARVNLRYGTKSDRIEHLRETCTACAGSMILEMAALSRLTGEPVFEEKAHKAMDELWKMRHRSSDLMGTVLNVHSGDWVRRDSGVGAGIDSYYEYCLKAYILLGDNKYLHRFNRHYDAVMKYISQGPMLLDVHMHRPHTTSRNYMDALLAFWPGLQVLKGDIKPAVETHEMLYQVMQRHTFIPEAFTTDFQVHWGNHPLRPEFLESTYFLYSATGDPYYLEVGKNVLKSLQKYARVPCGYAAVNDVRTGKKEDRMDSFVLSETFKYLYLLFADKDDVPVNLDEFIFTTEGHLFPLTLSGHGPNSTKILSGTTAVVSLLLQFHLNPILDSELENSQHAMSCPNTLSLFPGAVRKPLKHMVDGMCPRRTNKRRLTASEFSAANMNHLKVLKEMGINIIALTDGRVQLLHTPTAARSTIDAEEGLLFMQEMAELSKIQSQQPDPTPQVVSFPLKDDITGGKVEVITVQVGPAQFGETLKGDKIIKSRAVKFSPFNGCSDLDDLQRPILAKGAIAIMKRGDCMFVDKVRRAQKFGAIAAIVVDNVPGSNAGNSPMFSMSGDGTDDVKIPAVFMFAQDSQRLLKALYLNPMMEITIREMAEARSLESEESMFQKLKEFLNKHTGIVMGYEKTLEEGVFKASIGTEKIKITLEQHKLLQISPITEKPFNSHWSYVTKQLLKTLLQTENKQISIPLTMMRIYYKTLNPEGTHIDDPIEQTKWLLGELTKQYHAKDDDLVSAAPASESSILANIEKVAEEIRNLRNDPVIKGDKEFEQLSSLLLMHGKSQLLQLMENRNLLEALSGLEMEIKEGVEDELVKSEKKKVYSENKVEGQVARMPDEL
ncbi:ER degradation-enhancing alpha-mannosidase-like protein 3 isoform X2 [Euwallacea similis]|uniref:ER degradation-enhancing alpha-mannosidase-like protein 3 isoform X2 n=1 Tax=Euwallacea similis TaxID=1736056 RepID=UPI00344D4399